MKAKPLVLWIILGFALLAVGAAVGYRSLNPGKVFVQRDIRRLEVLLSFPEGRGTPDPTSLPEWCAPVPGLEVCRVQGHPLEAIMGALRKPATSRYLIGRSKEYMGVRHVVDIYVEFSDGHYRYLWAYEGGPEATFFGGGGRVINGRQVGYGASDPIYGSLFGYFVYVNPHLAQALPKLP